jgi:YD repeat-containing protein
MATPYNPTVTTSTRMDSSGNQLVKAIVTDPYGHPIQSQLSSDPYGTVYADTAYDGFGNMASTSNPYRSKSDSTYGVTNYSYDSLGRKTSQTNPDNTKMYWCYNNVFSTAGQTNCRAQLGSISGEWVDSADERGNDWQRTTDVFGNLKSVFEPNGSGATPSMESDYQYNALGNLLSVSQTGQSGDVARMRSFGYSSISQLLSSSNPESGSMSYTYDANGNVSSKTDARSIVTNYTYDSMNRLTSKTYSNDSYKTPISCFQYNASSIAGAGGNLVHNLTNAWTQPTGTVCTGSGGYYAPVSGSYISLKSFLSYDAMGRVTSAQQQQCIGGHCSAPSPYKLNMGYDLTGNLTQLTNSVGAQGSSLTLNSLYDSAGRSCLTTSSWTNGFSPNLFQSNPSSASSGYTPFGGLQNWSLGSTSATVSTSCRTGPTSAINLQQIFNNRLRVTNFSSTGQVP